MRFAPGLLPLLLTACIEAQHPVVVNTFAGEDLPEGYPTRMGTATLVEDGRSATLTTYDFSVGAFDASAGFTGLGGSRYADPDALPKFRLMAYPDENPKAPAGVLNLRATFAKPLKPGAQAQEAVVEVLMGDDLSGRRWTSAGTVATLVIDSFLPEEKDKSSGYGHATGHFAATICSGTGIPAVVAPGARCRQVSGQFDTQVQYEP